MISYFSMFALSNRQMDSVNILLFKCSRGIPSLTVRRILGINYLIKLLLLNGSRGLYYKKV